MRTTPPEDNIPPEDNSPGDDSHLTTLPEDDSSQDDSPGGKNNNNNNDNTGHLSCGGVVLRGSCQVGVVPGGVVLEP